MKARNNCSSLPSSWAAGRRSRRLDLVVVVDLGAGTEALRQGVRRIHRGLVGSLPFKKDVQTYF